MILSRILRIFNDPWHYIFLMLYYSRRLWSDKLYLSLIYRAKMGHWINWRSPQTFTEKIQWLKLYNRKPIYTTMVDKAEVKKYVADKIGDQYIIPTIGGWDTVDDIEWDSLPNQFVLKTTHGGGGCGIVICKNKENFDIAAAKKKLKKAIASDIYYTYREWPYKNVPKRIIAEKYLTSGNISNMSDETLDLYDYKFFCFGGKVKFFKIDFGRFIEHHANYYSTMGKLLDFGEIGLAPDPNIKIDLPDNLSEMIRIAEVLSNKESLIRVDLYNVQGRIYFGELTFFPASGLGLWTKDTVDEMIGKYIKLPNGSEI